MKRVQDTAHDQVSLSLHYRSVGPAAIRAALLYTPRKAGKGQNGQAR